MKVKKISEADGELKLKVLLDETELSKIKQHVLTDLSGSVKIAGFRAGRAPLSLVEKQLDSKKIQQEVLEHAINNAYPKAIDELKERTLSNPAITIDKFAPFSELEFSATVAVAGEIKLANYKGVKVKKEPKAVTDKEVSEVVKNLRKRLADKVAVARAAKSGDEVWIDFEGTDTKGKEIPGAKGQEYPLILGSNTFITGFEENLVGLKPGQKKEFKLKFPTDYHAKNLSGKQVVFKVKVNKVQEVKEPELNAEFAAKVGPFNTVEELKQDIKKQLAAEKQHKADTKYQNDLLEKIVKSSKVGAPAQLVKVQIESELNRLKQNLVYRGQTFKEYLEARGLSEQELSDKEVKPIALERVKAALILSEIAYKENIKVSGEELDTYITSLKSRYKDAQMQAQLDDPNNRSDIASQLLTQKTLERLRELNPS